MKVFMVMPFSDSISNQAYNFCIKKVCDEFNLEIKRADEIFTTNPVYNDIINEIQEASIIIVDISGKNANVFYELGIAHTLKQSHTIMITHDDVEDSPFNVSHFRIFGYKDSVAGYKKLIELLRKTLKQLLKDYKLIFSSEYKIASDVLSVAEHHGEMYALIGLAKNPGIFHDSIGLNTEGHSKENPSPTYHSMSVADGMKTFIQMGYVIIENDIIKLTDKGRGFASYLEDKGFVCDILNDQIFTEGFIPFLERIKRKQNQR